MQGSESANANSIASLQTYSVKSSHSGHLHLFNVFFFDENISLMLSFAVLDACIN